MKPTGMKKIVAFSLFVLLCLHTLGQARFGIVGGLLLTKTNSAFNSGFRPGVYLGIVTDLKLVKSISLMPQLKYSNKGERNVSGEKGTYNYLELPINFVYKIPTKAGRLSFGGGPVLAYMMKGSWTTDDIPKEEIYFKYDMVNQLDYGLNAIAGFEIKGGVFFNISYMLGLRDVWFADNIGTNKNRTLSLGIGFVF